MACAAHRRLIQLTESRTSGLNERLGAHLVGRELGYSFGSEDMMSILTQHTSQNMHPPSELDATYSALILTISGTSYETSSRLTGS